MVRENEGSGLKVSVCKRSAARPPFHGAGLNCVSADYWSQNHSGEGAAETSFPRVNPATHKPTAEGPLHPYPPLFHEGGGRLRYAPHERTSHHDDARLSVVEDRVALYTDPPEVDRLLYLQVETGESIHR